MKTKKSLQSALKSRNVQILLYVLVFGIAGLIIIVSRAATPPAPSPPSVYLSAANTTFGINTTFTIEVRENSGTNSVNAVQALVSYQVADMDFVSIDATTSVFDVQAQSVGGNGTVSIARGTATAVTGDQRVAIITFKTRTNGATSALAFSTGTALVSATNNTNLLTSLAQTGGASIVIDTTTPTVSLTAPLNGAVVSGGSAVQVTSTASDNTAVQSVDILIDGNVAQTISSPPYNFVWNTTGLSLASHTVQAKARDAFGNVGSSAIINVTLKDQTAPTVGVTAPLTGAKVSSNVTLNATSTDNTGGTGVNRVEFYVDGTLKITDTTSPYTGSWDSKTVLDGSHTIMAKSYDNASPANVGSSTTVTVTVDNADHTAPTMPTNLLKSSDVTTSITLSWSASTDNVGVTSYRLQRNGATIATPTPNTLTFTDAGLTPGTSYTYNLVAFDAAGNVSPAATLTASTKSLKPGDTDGDNDVDIFDLSVLLSNYQKTGPSVADFNSDGKVDIFDLSILLSNYGK